MTTPRNAPSCGHLNVLGLDLSLTATGVAHCDGTTDTWKVDATGAERLRVIRDRVVSLLDAAVDLVVIEDYAFSRAGAHSHEIGELGGVVRLALHVVGVPWVPVLPTSLKKYATGKGNATKPDMRMALFQRFGIDERDDNRVDALWLRAMALDHYGEPVVTMPAAHREALTKVSWPALEPA